MKADEKKAQAALGNLIKFAEKNPGTVVAVTNLLTKKQGVKVHRQQVECWLHSNPEKRMQPRFGMGLLLVDAGDEVMAKTTAEKERKQDEAKS